MVGTIIIARELVPNISKERVKTIIVKLFEEAAKSGNNDAMVYSDLSQLFVPASLSESNDKPYSAFDKCKDFCNDSELGEARKNVKIRNPGRHQWNHYPNPLHCKKNVFDEALEELVSEGKLILNKTAKSKYYSLSQTKAATQGTENKNWASSVRIDAPQGSIKPKGSGWEVE